MSMFTGLYPGEHGVRDARAVLAPEIETFPEAFQRAGFRTAGFTEGGYVSGRYGFRRGFERFQARDRDRVRQVGHTFARGIRFLAGVRPGERFLLFLHTYAVHAPYDAPEGFQKLFWSAAPPAGSFFPGARALSEREAAERSLPPDVLAWLTARYDAGIRETDEALRGLVETLERLGLDGDTTLVVTADHGEELGDHGRLQHSQLYRETMRVPLLVVHPDAPRAVRHRKLVELIDLAPTLYELARLTPRGTPSGESVARWIGRVAPAPSAVAAAGTETARADGEGGDRALYRRDGAAAVESLLVFAPPPEGWAARSLVFDAPPGPLAFDARSYGTPRRLRVRDGAGDLAAVALTEQWAPVRVALGDRPARLRLEVDDCTLAPEGRAMRCYGFQVRGLRPTRLELYDLDADPGQRRDLARERPDATRLLLRELLAFRPVLQARAAEAPLDPGLEESLRALGYLR